MLNKNENIINRLAMILLCLTIVSFSIIIGGNEKDLPILPMVVIGGVSFVVLLIKKLKYKEKLIKSKTDIAVSIFIMVTFLPLLFNTYCSYQGTIEFILKYIFVYEIYLLSRNVISTQKKKDIIVSITIISSLAIIIFGFDILNGKNLNKIYDFLDLNYKDSYRFTSTFGYANTVSIYLSFCVFLAINRIENVKSKIVKIIYTLYIILCSYIIYTSYSRLVLILYFLSLLLYFGINKYTYIKDNKKLKIIIIAIFSMLLLVVPLYWNIFCKSSKPFDMKINSSTKIKKIFEPNQEYNFKFELDVIDENTESDIYLNIIEVNKYFKETIITEQKLNIGEQALEIKIKPSEDVYYIKFECLNNGKNKNNENNKIIIKKMYINNQEYILSYKYIPKIISRLITSFVIEDDSIHKRIQFWQNCIRIFKDSPIIGHGGNAWKRLSLAYEEYPYKVKETHSYFFELLISYGILGVLAFFSLLIVFICSIIKMLKNNKEFIKRKASVFLGLLLFIVYSLVFDFCMSYVLTMLIVFLFIAILQENEVETYKKNNSSKKLFKMLYIFDYISLVLFGICFIVLLTANIAKYLCKDSTFKYKLAPYVFEYRTDYVKENCNSNLEEIKQLILKEPYLKQSESYLKYWNAIFLNANNLNENELLEYVDFGISRYENIRDNSPMFFDMASVRIETIFESLKILEKIDNDILDTRIQKLKDIAVNEIRVNIANMNDLKRHYENQEKIEKYKKIYKSLLEEHGITIDELH